MTHRFKIYPARGQVLRLPKRMLQWYFEVELLKDRESFLRRYRALPPPCRGGVPSMRGCEAITCPVKWNDSLGHILSTCCVADHIIVHECVHAALWFLRVAKVVRLDYTRDLPTREEYLAYTVDTLFQQYLENAQQAR